jgi:hypothetical protein
MLDYFEYHDMMFVDLYGQTEVQMNREDDLMLDRSDTEKVVQNMLKIVAELLERDSVEIVDTVVCRLEGEADAGSLREYAEELTGVVADYVRELKDLEVSVQLKRVGQ